VPVYLLYWTAFVNADGRVEFRPDVYRRDPAVKQALAVEPTGRAPVARGGARG
jgi:murein L,D-transpeptidase YcbB/YkuD